MGDAPGPHVIDHGSHESLEVVAVVSPVARVFGGDKGVDQVDRNVAVRDIDAVVRIEECT